jgi:hypothetical protein
MEGTLIRRRARARPMKPVRCIEAADFQVRDLHRSDRLGDPVDASMKQRPAIFGGFQ